MQHIRILLRTDNIRPTINIETNISTRTVLVDTGADTVIRFSDRDTFKLEFPNAEETDYITYVSGLGGTNKKECPIYKIPKLELKDKDNGDKFVIRNLYVVIYDVEENHGVDYILGTTVFNRVNYSFINQSKEKYMEIVFDREVYCSVNIAKDISGNPIIINGKTVITDVHTYFTKNN